MAISNIETVGIALIVVGIIFIYLTRTGRFSDKDAGGEISSKIFTLKGGTGLVLVALGAILLVLGGLQTQDLPPPATMPNTFPPASTISTTPAPVASPMPTTPATTIMTIAPPVSPAPPTTQPPEYYAYPMEVTWQYLIGTWQSSQGVITETIIFYQGGTFYLENFNTITGETLSLSGIYEVADSGVYLYTGGTQQYYQVTYIDENTFKIDADIYTRVG